MKNRMSCQVVLLYCFVVCAATIDWAAAADWSAFRGPKGNGISSAENVPTEWGPDQNILWKFKLPQPGNSSPIVSNGRVFLTCAEDPEGKGRSLYCFNADSGEKLWVQTVQIDKAMPTHKTNPYCAATPAADGRRVIAWHGSAGLHCYDYKGKELWSADLGEIRHWWGYASSPVIYKDRVILQRAPGKGAALMAFDLESGKTLWSTAEEVAGDGERRATDGAYVGTWSTPVIAEVDGQDQILCAMTTRLVAYNPDDGQILWYCEGLSGPKGDLSYSSPMWRRDTAYVIGGFRGPSFATYMGGSGDITDTHRLWRHESSPQNIGSGVFIGNHAYLAHTEPGIIECIHVPTGTSKWKSRGAGGQHWGSVILAGGLCYVTNQDGETVIFKPNPQEYEEVAVNPLNEPSNSTPAPVDGRIYIRTFDHLYCIGEM